MLISHSPFRHLTSDRGLLEKLAKAFTTVRFSRGEVLPDSPFYFIARGAVICRVIADGRPVTTKCAPRPVHNCPHACPHIGRSRYCSHGRVCLTTHRRARVHGVRRRRAGAFVNWSSEFSKFGVGPLRAAVSSLFTSCVPDLHLGKGHKGLRRDQDQHTMEMIGASDGHACVLTAWALHKFMENSHHAANLIRNGARVRERACAFVCACVCVCTAFGVGWRLR